MEARENLIFDRTVEDINNRTAKGYYNYNDLNRIEEWCIYLANLLNEFSYPVTIITKAKAENPYNILVNGTLWTNSNGWSTSSANTLTHTNDYLTVHCTMGDGTGGTYPVYQNYTRITGSDYTTRQVLYASAKVKGRTMNRSNPRVYMSYYVSGSTSVSFNDLRSIDGLSGSALNDGNWHTLSRRLTTYDGNDYYEFDRIAFGINSATENDEMDVKEVLLINLTKMFGIGNEPDKTWCDENLNDYSRWQMWSFPTSAEMERIRTNVAAIKQAYIAYTNVPSSLNRLTYDKANALEKVLDEIDKTLKYTENYIVYSGVCNSGQNRQWQQRYRRRYSAFREITIGELDYEYISNLGNKTIGEVSIKANDY